MTNPLREQVDRLLRTYADGDATRRCLVGELITLAANPDFVGLIDRLPSEIIGELEMVAWEAPAHPEDVISIFGGMMSRDADPDATDRAERAACYWGARRLREQFFPNEPMPVFEPIKLAGPIAESVVIDGAVVVFGDFSGCAVRKHPLQIRTPAGRNIVARAVREGFFRRPDDAVSADPIVQACGQYGYVLDTGGVLPVEIPLGSEVWVNRTAALEIPPHRERLVGQGREVGLEV